MDKDFVSTFNHPNLVTTTLWFKTKWFKIVLTALGIVAVVLVVLFSQQIGDLLKFFGSKAALQTSNFVLAGNNFLSNGYQAEIWDATNNTWVGNQNIVTVDPLNRLIINPE